MAQANHSQNERIMKTVAPALIALVVLAGIATAARAFDAKTFFE
jgi:hypothetical protein